VGGWRGMVGGGQVSGMATRLLVLYENEDVRLKVQS
jgi:hypothetical protein